MADVEKLVGSESPLEVGQKINEIIDKGVGGAGLQLFDSILKDHALTYEESKGLALQGTYVYKEAIAGSRYGYPDFYNKVIEEYNEATSTETINGVTVKVHSNGHKFYDIANKTAIDKFFDTYGFAWFYGVDTANERIFLPRNNWFAIKGTEENTPVCGNGNGLGMMAKKGDTLYEGAMSSHYNSNQISSSFWIEVGGFGAIGSTDGTTKGSEVFNNNSVVGVTTNSDHSGIIAKTSDVLKLDETKYLYICVGNTTNYEGMTEVVNQGMEILEQVNQGLEVKANKTQIDGQWVTTWIELSTAIAITSNIVYLDLTDILPKDSYRYEITGYWQTGRNDSGGTDSQCNLYNNGQYVIRLGTDGNNQRHTVFFTTIIDSSRKNMGYEILANALGSGTIALTGYRRLGTNS